MVTVAVTGKLDTPRLSTTTSRNVTVPDVFGTVTGCTENAPLVVGLLGDSATKGPVWPGAAAASAAAAADVIAVAVKVVAAAVLMGVAAAAAVAGFAVVAAGVIGG
jgi:hypothetical protein